MPGMLEAAHEEGRRLGLSQSATHLRNEARRLRSGQWSRLTAAERDRMIVLLTRLARTVESLK